MKQLSTTIIVREGFIQKDRKQFDLGNLFSPHFLKTAVAEYFMKV